MSTEQSYVGRGNCANTPPQSTPTPTNLAHRSPPLLLSDWNAVEQLLNQAVSQNPHLTTPNGTLFDSADPLVNVEQAKSDLLTVMDSFTEGSDPVPHLLQLVQVWSLSESGDLAHRENQRSLRLMLNLAQFLAELRQAYNNYAYFLEQTELMGGAEHEI